MIQLPEWGGGSSPVKTEPPQIVLLLFRLVHYACVYRMLLLLFSLSLLCVVLLCVVLLRVVLLLSLWLRGCVVVSGVVCVCCVWRSVWRSAWCSAWRIVCPHRTRRSRGRGARGQNLARSSGSSWRSAPDWTDEHAHTLICAMRTGHRISRTLNCSITAACHNTQ